MSTTWDKYPIGTKAYASTGGFWERVMRGWKWCNGNTFPTPGGDVVRIKYPGQFDDLPAENFGNLKPLPEGYAVVWFQGSEMYHGTKRGTDLELGPTWNRYWARRWCFEHHAENPEYET